MAPLVGGQLECLHKRVAANVADEVPLVGVDPPVDGQGVGPLEGLAADVALIRASVAVRDQVALVEVLCSEKFRAHFALVKRLRRGMLS